MGVGEEAEDDEIEFEKVVSEGAGGVGLLVNRVVFAGIFLEMLFWGYIYSTLREESRELAVEFVSRARAKEEEE